MIHHKKSKIIFYNAKAELKIGDEVHFSIFLDIDKNNKVISIDSEVKSSQEWIDSFLYFETKAQGKFVNEILAINWAKEIEEASQFRSIVFYPVFLFSKAFNDFLGVPISCEVSKQNHQDLVCRCFGIYQNQLVEQARKEGISDLNHFLRSTMASQGCGSCSNEVRAIFHRELTNKQREVKSSRIMGLTHAHFLIKCDDWIQTWLKRENVTEKIKIAPVLVASDTLIIRISPKESATKLLPSLRDYLTSCGVPQYLKLAIHA